MNDIKRKIREDLKSVTNMDAKLEKFAEYIDQSNASRSVEITDYLIAQLTSFIKNNKRKLNSEQLALSYYFLGNTWGDGNSMLQEISDKNSLELFELKYKKLDEDFHHEKIIFAYRSAYNESGFWEMSSIRKCQLLTNLANSLSHVGRTIEAIEYWEMALKEEPKFTMAKGNLGYGISKYMQLQFDSGHQYAFAQSVLKNFEELERDDTTQDDAWQFFQSEKTKIISIKDKLSETFDWDNYVIDNKSELEYRQWAGKNRLFLNPLNDISILQLALRDPLMLPSITTSIDTGNQFHGLFNLIKQEYVSARYILYEGVNVEKQHFSDKEVQLYNTLDYASTSLNIEKVKLAYRACYSLIDKVSYFLIEYFNLPIKQKDSNLSLTMKKIEEKGLLTSNWLLKAIKWLDRDINEERYQKYLDSDTKLLREIRNHLEHKYLKVIDMGTFEGKVNAKNGINDNLAYYIPRDKFNQKAIKLFKLVRSLILYMIFAIQINEVIKKKDSKKGLIMPMYLSTIDDNWKI